MLKQACYGFNYDYVHYLLKLMTRLEIQPNEKIVENLQLLMKLSNNHFNIKVRIVQRQFFFPSSPLK